MQAPFPQHDRMIWSSSSFLRPPRHLTKEGWIPMAGMQKEIVYDKSLGVVAKMLREEAENVTSAPLPKRWVELILHLDEQERKNFERSKSRGPGVSSAEP